MEWLRYKCVSCEYEGGARSTTKKPKCGKCGSRKLNFSNVKPESAEEFVKKTPEPKEPQEAPKGQAPTPKKNYIDSDEDWA